MNEGPEGGRSSDLVGTRSCPESIPDAWRCIGGHADFRGRHPAEGRSGNTSCQHHEPHDLVCSWLSSCDWCLSGGLLDQLLSRFPFGHPETRLDAPLQPRNPHIEKLAARRPFLPCAYTYCGTGITYGVRDWLLRSQIRLASIDQNQKRRPQSSNSRFCAASGGSSRSKTPTTLIPGPASARMPSSDE